MQTLKPQIHTRRMNKNDGQIKCWYYLVQWILQNIDVVPSMDSCKKGCLTTKPLTQKTTITHFVKREKKVCNATKKISASKQRFFHFAKIVKWKSFFFARSSSGVSGKWPIKFVRFEVGKRQKMWPNRR